MTSRVVRSLVILGIAVALSAGLALAVKPGPDPRSVPPAQEDLAATTPALEPAADGECVAESKLNPQSDTFVLEGSADATAASARPCKPCKDRPWCACSYNGMPRVSCNPCCWGYLGVPQICAD